MIDKMKETIAANGGGFVEVAVINDEVYCCVVVAGAACRRIHSNSKVIVAFISKERKRLTS